MNMKKTIAAVSAASVAVSAVATTASAAKTLTYNLVAAQKTDASVNLTIQIDNDNVIAATTQDFILAVHADNINLKDKAITLTGYNGDDGRQLGAPDYTFESDKTKANWTGFAEWVPFDDKKGGVYILKISSGNAIHSIFTTAQTDSTGKVIGTQPAKMRIVATFSGAGKWEETTGTYAADNMKQETLNDLLVQGADTLGNFIGPKSTPNNSIYALYTGDSVNAIYDSLTVAFSFNATKTEFTSDTSAQAMWSDSGSAWAVANTRATWIGAGWNAKKYPYKTTLNGGWLSKDAADEVSGLGVIDTTQKYVDVIYYLEHAKLIQRTDGAWQGYKNVSAVINDVIANYDEVEFKFNTATDKIKNASGLGEYGGNDETYLKFNQHLFNLFGDENTGMVFVDDANANDWWLNNNLFQGAVVVNGQYSMQLSDIQKFTYGGTYLSFKWEDVTDSANVNEFVKYVWSLQLCTSSTWYWDNLVITADNTSAEDAGSGEGATGNEDSVDDTIDDTDDDTIDDTDTDDVDDVDDGADADNTADDAADTAVADNPGTGNAPVALAVIPVALAAAAVVAKKRG